MPSNSGNRRRRSKRRRPSGALVSSSEHKSKGREMTSSFALAAPASRGAIQIHALREGPPIYKAFLVAFIGVFFMIFIGVSNSILASGLALVFPGIALLASPPKRGLGKLGDLSVFGLLGSLLLAFLPLPIWVFPDWRARAIESFTIDLPAVVSIQPWISLEAWMIALAGLGWLYAALQWPINLPGRRRLSLWLTVLIAGTAGGVVWLNLAGIRPSGISGAPSINSSYSWEYMVNFLTLGGVVTFAYALQALQRRALRSLVAISATLLSLVGLILENSQIGVLLYCLGVLFCCLYCLRTKSFQRTFKRWLIFAVLTLCIVSLGNDRINESIISFAFAQSEADQDLSLNVYQDTATMILDNPITGVGLGNYAAIFPQYREASIHHKNVTYPKSDLLWITAEGGLLALASLTLLAVAFARRCRHLNQGKSASYRIFSLITLFVFIILSFLDTPGGSPAIVYFIVLFAILALPKHALSPAPLPLILWRVLGGALLCVGLFWFIAGVAQLPWHSSLRTARIEEKIRTHIDLAEFNQAQTLVNEWISFRPMDWRGYSQRARLTLKQSGNLQDAMGDFERARFVEPVLGIVGIEEGNAWIPYDSKRATSAWDIALDREIDQPERYFSEILERVQESPDQMDAMGQISKKSALTRVTFLSYLKGDKLMHELRTELAEDPGLCIYSREQRTGIISHWIRWGDKEAASDFIGENEELLDNVWWLRSLIYEGRAEYMKAVETIRDSLEAPKTSSVHLDEATIVKLKRECVLSPNDLSKVRPLLDYYVIEGAYENALSLLERMLEFDQLPSDLIYWRAQCLYHIEDYVDSWLAFEAYLKLLWGE